MKLLGFLGSLRNGYAKTLISKTQVLENSLLALGNSVNYRNHSLQISQQLVRNTTGDTIYTEEFLKTLPYVIDEMTITDNLDPNYKQPFDWLKKVLEENTKGGRSMRSLLIPHVYYSFVKTEPTPEMKKKVMILAWCNELIERQIFMQDDIMDHSQNRWGRPSWHAREEVGLSAFNDCVAIVHSCYILLKRYLSDDSYYLPIIHEFWNYSLTIALGIMMEFEGTRDFKKGLLDRYNMNWYKINAMRKSAPAFILPIQIAIHLAKKFDERANRIIQDITYEYGYLYLVQNDYLDAYGDQSIKASTDIANGRMTWTFITAYHQATNAQKKELLKNFGKYDPDAVKAVKNLYDELDLPKSYQKLEKERTNRMLQLINQLPDYTPKEPFHLTIEFFFKNY